MLRVVFLLLLVLTCAPLVLSQVGDNPMVMLSEFKFRERVKSSVDPVFPEKALADGANGLVIVAVHFDDEGNFHNARVLKSPHPEISAAVTKALESWKINPYVIDKVLKSRVQTEIRFYFEIEDGAGHIKAAPVEVQKLPSREFKKFDLQFRTDW